jgi:hypothetical protein
VGRWVIRTAESVVFTLCPPGPDERKTSTRMSDSGISMWSVCTAQVSEMLLRMRSPDERPYSTVAAAWQLITDSR